MTCRLCGRETAKEGFCEFHLKARQNITNSYPAWHRALGLSWKDYLSQIAENSSAGNWVKEVAKYLIEHEET